MVSAENPAIFARRSSVNSLKELVIILTGLTITSGFAVSFHSVGRFFLRSTNPNYIVVWQTYFSQITLGDRFGNIFRLLLLIVCVMRFHHGNIMVLDKNYLTPDRKHDSNRNLFLDFIAILAMSIGFSSMGFSTFDPILFNTAYMLILLVSVCWIALTVLRKVNEGRRLARDSKTNQTNGWLLDNIHELGAQIRWFFVNIVTFIVFVLVFALDVAHKPEWLCAVILVNSVLDIWLNWSDYFPAPPVASPTNIEG